MKTIDNLHIQQSKYHGKNFEGNQCRAILKSVHKLNIPKELVEFKNVFIAIKKLCKLVNAEVLSSSYHKVIDNLWKSWYDSSVKFRVSTTPKIHIILDHLEDYFDETNTTPRVTSDELCENMHQFLHKRLIRSLIVLSYIEQFAT